MKNASAAIAGLHLRMDVPTKCRIVESILTRGLSSKEEYNNYIEVVATSYNVNPVTVKMWVSKYEKFYKVGKSLPKGTMSFSFTTIDGSTINKADVALAKLRNELGTLKEKYHPDQNKRTLKQIIDELVSGKDD